MEIIVTSKFEKRYKKLPLQLKTKAKVAENIFRKNQFDLKLKTHKLHGKYKDFWAFSISSSHRIMFQFIDDDTVAFVDIGDHSVYK